MLADALSGSLDDPQEAPACQQGGWASSPCTKSVLGPVVALASHQASPGPWVPRLHDEGHPGTYLWSRGKDLMR